VLRFDPRKVNAHERVGTFYANLARVELEGAGSKTVKSNPAAKAKGASLKAEDYEKSFVEDDWQEMP
jgi:ATP-dependent DNA helicase PIF1